MNAEFLRGWIAATNHTSAMADKQWAGYSRHLTDSERETLEQDGFRSGWEMGQAWRAMYGHAGSNL